MTAPAGSADDVTDDAILNGRLRLYQPRRGHRFGHDAILLAAAVEAKPGDRVAEFGAGVGAAGLALLSRVTGSDATLFEIDPALCALAEQNLTRNGFTGRARVVAQDVTLGTNAGLFDSVFMNPPFNDPRHQTSPDPQRGRAHAAPADLLSQWTGSACRALRDGGTLTLIWRADGLPDVLRTLAADFGDVTVLPVYPAPDRAAIRIIATAVKGAGGPLAILAPLFLNDASARPSADAEAILRQGVALPLRQG